MRYFLFRFTFQKIIIDSFYPILWMFRIQESIARSFGASGRIFNKKYMEERKEPVDISRGQRVAESGERRVRVHLRAAYVLYANER